MANRASEDSEENLAPGVWVRLKPETAERLRLVADEEERPISTVARRLIEEALVTREAQERLRRLA